MKRLINIIFIVLLGCNTMINYEFKESFIKNNDIELYLKSFGQGDPIIIIHGGPGFDHIHMLPFKKLADKYQVIFYDQRTTGKSSGNPDSLSITVDKFVSDLESIRKGLGLNKIILIGHSWGARLSMEYAIKYSMNLDKLILLSPSGTMDFMNQYLENIQKKTDEESRIKIKEIEKSDSFKNRELKTIENYYNISIKPFFYVKNKSKLLDLTMLEKTAKNQSIVAELLIKEIMPKNILNDLKGISCPALIIHGESDPLPIEVPQEVHKNIPNSKMIVLEKTGHFMFAETPEQTITAIREFLKDE
jgi:proline iminopeptidase